MPFFQYKAKRPDAQTVMGQLVADHRDDAIDKINQLGLIPISVEEGTAGSTPGGRKSGRVRVRELYLFSQQLVNLMKAGVPILRSLELISRQTRNAYFSGVIQSLRYSVQSGRAFSESLADYPKVFSPLYVTMVRAGEESGNLKDTIMDIARHLRQQDEFASKVRTAMAYPVLMAVLGVGTVIFVLTYVLPQISGLFDNFKQALPMPTLVVLAVSGFLRQWGLWLAGALFVGGMALRGWLVTAPGRLALSRFKLALPGFSTFVLRVDLARFCRTLQMLLKSGVPIVRAIKLASPVLDNELIRAQMDKCQEDLLAGRSLGECLESADLIPPLMSQLLSVGEESGALVQTLQDISDTYEQETNELIKTMSTLLEPAMIIVVGSIVGFVVMAMLLPIFQLDVFAR